jgi:PAS domain S-box-containing protein
MPDDLRKSSLVHLLSNDSLPEQLALKDRALSAAAEGVTISDNLQPDNPIIYANSGFEKLTGYRVGDVLGINCRFLQGPDTDPETVAEIRKALLEERDCTVEILNYRKDGSTFWNRLSITPVRNADGKVTNFIGIQSDITKRKNAEEALQSTAEKLAAANRRMKNDLEEARQLQLAMLPTTLPELSYLDLAVRMQTAQEVGGDYYDFYVGDNDDLTIAVGDATGHGLKAGTIVTATKILFNSLVLHPNPVSILQEMSRALKKMRFRNMFMAMIIAKVNSKRLLISSAGMPFTYYYSAASGEVSEIRLKGMPLGAFPDFSYSSREIDLQEGDTFLLMSDGLSELRNERGDFFGEDRIKELFTKFATDTSAVIIDNLYAAAIKWTQNTNLQDDMTLMVLKVTR